MTGNVVGFIVWVLCGLLIGSIGVSAWFKKTPMGFWANAEVFEVKDVKKYNRAVGKLFLAYGGIFILLGLPLLAGQNSALILLSVLGVAFETIAIMGIYICVIEQKYKK